MKRGLVVLLVHEEAVAIETPVLARYHPQLSGWLHGYGDQRGDGQGGRADRNRLSRVGGMDCDGCPGRRRLRATRASRAPAPLKPRHASFALQPTTHPRLRPLHQISTLYWLSTAALCLLDPSLHSLQLLNLAAVVFDLSFELQRLYLLVSNRPLLMVVILGVALGVEWLLERYEEEDNAASGTQRGGFARIGRSVGRVLLPGVMGVLIACVGWLLLSAVLLHPTALVAPAVQYIERRVGGSSACASISDCLLITGSTFQVRRSPLTPPPMLPRRSHAAPTPLPCHSHATLTLLSRCSHAAPTLPHVLRPPLAACCSLTPSRRRPCAAASRARRLRAHVAPMLGEDRLPAARQQRAALPALAGAREPVERGARGVQQLAPQQVDGVLLLRRTRRGHRQRLVVRVHGHPSPHPNPYPYP